MSILAKITDVLGGVIPIQNSITDAQVVLPASDGVYIYHNPLNFDALPVSVQACFAEWVPGRVSLSEKKIYRFRDVCISWHGVIFKNFNLFVPSLMYPELAVGFKGKFLLRQWLGKRQALPENKVMALVFDQWSAVNYFHWIIEAIPKLIVLEKSNEKITMLLPNNLPNYVLETVKIFGFSDYITIEPNVVYSAKTLLWPERTGTYWLQNVSLLQEARGRVLKTYALDIAQPLRRTYVSRAKSKIRRLLNEEDLYDVLANNGFEIVFFDNMSFAEQIKIAAESEVIIGVHGANLTNLLFMRPQTSVIELINEKSVNLAYFKLASYCDVRYYCQPCQNAGEIVGNDTDLRIDVALFSQLLEQVVTSRLPSPPPT